MLIWVPIIIVFISASFIFGEITRHRSGGGVRGERSSNQDRKGFGTLLHQEGMVGRSKKGAAEERGGDLRRFVQAEIDIVEGDFYMQEGTEP